MMIYPSFALQLFHKLIGRNIQRLDDIYALHLVEEFLPSKANFPITGSSLGFHALATILNDIKINGRKNIIEFGAGLSTIVLAKYAAMYNNDFRVISVEHDTVYLAIVKQILESENLSDQVVFIESALEGDSAESKQGWYCRETISKALGQLKFDMVLIDGPISHRDGSSVRYSAIDFMSTRLSLDYSIYLDDINRMGERIIVDRAWKQYRLRFRKISQTLAIAHHGQFYNPIP